jgi:hypothetical protein
MEVAKYFIISNSIDTDPELLVLVEKIYRWGFSTL